MLSNEFEQAFDNFLGGQDYDKAEDALFSVVRAAFLAGWRAAGGEPPREHKMLQIVTDSADGRG